MRHIRAAITPLSRGLNVVIRSTGRTSTVISLQDAVAILSKWKEESAHIVVAAESPFRQSLRGIHERGVRWTMSQCVRVSCVDPKQGIVEFEGPTGNLSLCVGGCRFVYGEAREAPPEMREAAEAESVSALSIFFPYDEGFLFYELRVPCTIPYVD